MGALAYNYIYLFLLGLPSFYTHKVFSENATVALKQLEDCLNPVQYWTAENLLKLNAKLMLVISNYGGKQFFFGYTHADIIPMLLINLSRIQLKTFITFYIPTNPSDQVLITPIFYDKLHTSMSQQK